MKALAPAAALPGNPPINSDATPFPIVFIDILEAVLFFNFVNPDLYIADMLLRPEVMPEHFTGTNLADSAPIAVSTTVLRAISDADRRFEPGRRDPRAERIFPAVSQPCKRI